jgi:hypothetical protein
MPSGTNFGLKETATQNNPTSNAAKSNTTPVTGLGTSYVVATLPGSAPTGSTALVTDSTAFTPGSAPTGGSTTVVPVFYNGSAWIMF